MPQVDGAIILYFLLIFTMYFFAAQAFWFKQFFLFFNEII